MTNVYEPACEAERRLQLSYINIAHRGVKSHLGKIVNDHLALVLFDRPKSRETTVALWNMRAGEAVTSRNLPFPSGMLWDWDWRAEALERAFEELLLPLDPNHFTSNEIKVLREQLEEGVAQANSAHSERGVQVHPRMLEARSKGANI